MTTRRPGRRPGDSGTREAIEQAARQQFAAHGFGGATVRAIAADAGVDAALIAHFFGSKRGLFLAVLSPPAEVLDLVPAVLDGPVETMGERIAGLAVRVLGDPALGARVEAMIRTAAGDPEAAELLRGTIEEHLMTPIRERLAAEGIDDPGLRANLVGATMAGVVFARRVIGLEPVASADSDRIAGRVAAGLQRYLTG